MTTRTPSDNFQKSFNSEIDLKEIEKQIQKDLQDDEFCTSLQVLSENN